VPGNGTRSVQHGALCIAYSGRCLLSGYFNHRDPNQGTCTNSCRWDYQVKNAAEDATGDLGRMEVIPLNFQRAIEEADARPFSTLHQQRATRWPTVLI
jgi:putative protease